MFIAKYFPLEVANEGSVAFLLEKIAKLDAAGLWHDSCHAEGEILGFFQTCMAFITAYVFIMYAFKRNDHKLWNLTRDFVKTKKNTAETWIRKKIRRTKVESANETSIEECGKSIEIIGY